LAALVISMLFLIGLLGFLASHWSSPVYQRRYTPRFLTLLTITRLMPIALMPSYHLFRAKFAE
jgi:hypothetical protein